MRVIVKVIKSGIMIASFHLTMTSFYFRVNST